MKTKTDFIALDYDYFDFQGKNYIKITGKNSKRKRICLIDTCPVYLWAILKDGESEKNISELIKKIEKIEIEGKGRTTKIEKVEVHEMNFLGKKVKALKIFATNYKDLHDIADCLDFESIEKRRGYDIGFVNHYIIEKKINPLQWYEISGELLNNSEEFGGIDSHLKSDLCMKLEKHSDISDREIPLKVLAYDIETDELKIGKGEILMISLVSENFKKVITWKKIKEKPEYVEYVEDESEMLEKFAEYINHFSPDILVGYFSDGFDLPYIKTRAEKHNVYLGIGVDGSQPRISKGTELTVNIDGIVHIDLLKFIRTAYSQYLQSETLSLNEVAKELLGEGKKDFEIKHSSKIDSDGWKKYYEYNLHDSFLAYQIFNKVWPDLLEFTRVIQEQLFNISRNGMSKNVESYILHHLSKYNEIPEKRPTHDEIGKRKTREKYVGAFVFEPTPGIYDDVAVFDFTSYWPSIIVSFNLSRSTLLDSKEKDSLEVDIGKKIYFSKKSGFFSLMLKELIEKRKKYKQELNKQPDVLKRARSNAFKLLANASYGYQGFFGARYYCPEASAAVTSISRDFIKKTINKINEEGYKTIYSDTDSIMILVNKKSENEVIEFLKKINSDLPGIMELELEGFFKRGIWVTTRGGSIGAKKKYALISKDGRLKIRGFETVRRDWCKLARNMQNKVLRLILEDGDEKRAFEYFNEIFKKLNKREIPKEEIIIRTQLKKSISEYKSISPHVIAAQKMHDRKIPIAEGGLVEYFIAETREAKKLVREKVKLPDEKGEYNIEYYLNHQLVPAVENIFQVFKVEISNEINKKKQKTLF